jgi:DNA-binding CsgD family transcriptional regulator
VVESESVRIAYQVKLGAIDLTEADRVCQLLGAVRDPLVRASFQSTYSSALVLAARYDDGLEIAESLVELARHYRIDFALPYGLCAVATALAGRRRWQSANLHIEQALRAARDGRNAFGEHVCLAAKIRILAQEGRHEDALTIRVPELRGSLPSGRAEALASIALVLASLSRLNEARELIDELRGSSVAIEPRVLTFAVDAVVALKGRDPGVSQRIGALATAALDAGAPDLLVTAYRSTPELLGLLLRLPQHGAEVAQVVSRAGDEDLAGAIGRPLGRGDPRSRLSPRELDVLECLQQRLTNRQIAASLFISESTVKVHVHRIFDKLGVRSRNAIAVQALLQGSAHATSAIGEGEAVDS